MSASGSSLPVNTLIDRASDFQLLLMMQSFKRRLEEIDYEPNRVVSNFPEGTLGVSTEEVISWSEQTEICETRIAGADALQLARMLLRAGWEAPALRPIAEAAVRTPDDDRLGGGVALKVGTLATVLMLVSSTSFDVRFPGVVIHKDALSPESLAGLAKILESVRFEITGQGVVPHPPR